jgi:membrane-bound ClpP family serine protease
MSTGFRSALIAALSISLGALAADDVSAKLEVYGREIEQTVEPGAARFLKVTQTTASPLRAYVVRFETNSGAMMRVPNASSNTAAFQLNLGITMVWQKRFCTDQVKKIMREHSLNLVSGELVNSSGKTQRMAVCIPE